jgi:hypothetical protein
MMSCEDDRTRACLLVILDEIGLRESFAPARSGELLSELIVADAADEHDRFRWKTVLQKLSLITCTLSG